VCRRESWLLSEKEDDVKPMIPWDWDLLEGDERGVDGLLGGPVRAANLLHADTAAESIVMRGVRLICGRVNRHGWSGTAVKGKRNRHAI
jgi:hypothetical protein